ESLVVFAAPGIDLSDLIRQEVSVLGDQLGKGFVCRTTLAARIVCEREFETSVAFVRLKLSFTQRRFTIATLERHKDLEAMVARGGRLQFRRLASCSFSLVEVSLGEKNTGQADSGLVGEGVEFNRLSGHLPTLFKSAKINHHSRQEIVGGWVPRRELLRAREFG